MPTNSLAPGFIKLYVESTQAEHVHTLPCKPYLSAFTTWFLEHKNDSIGASWTSSLTAYITVAKAFLPTSATYTYAELWTQADENSDPVYRDTTTLAIAGTNVAAIVLASQLTFSCRTINGGNSKLVHLDTSLAPNQKFKPVYTGATLAYVNYVIGATSFLVGRDNSFLTAIPQALTKTNDKLRRKYNLT